MIQNKLDWDKHWNSLKKRRHLFSYVLQIYRKYIIANAVKYYFDKYFPHKGIFIEAGCGTAQSSIKINKQGRILIGLDISYSALKEAQDNKKMDFFIQADIFKMPFKKQSIEGLWNLGVMEHFNTNEIKNILNEFSNIIKPQHYAIILWPPIYGSSQIFLGLIEKIHNLLFKNKIIFSPHEPSRLKSSHDVNKFIKETNFYYYKYYFSWRDFFIYSAIILKSK